MPEQQQPQLPEVLLSRYRSLRAEMDAEISQVTAHIDVNDPDQIALVKPELDRIFAAGQEKLQNIFVDEVLCVAMEPLIKMIGPLGFLAGGEVNLKTLPAAPTAETVIPRTKRP